MTLGRNEHCHCGSGKKYKHCHYDADRSVSAQPAPAEAHRLDEEMVERISSYLAGRFNDDFRELVEALDSFPYLMPQLTSPWIAYVAAIEGRRGVEWFLDERGATLSRPQRDWLELQQKTHLSVWEVLQVERGRSITLRDAFTGETRVVHEVSASRVMETHLFLLGRVVDAEPRPVICGMHPRPLFPDDAADVIEGVRRKLRRRTAVPPERLRNDAIAWRMLEEWTRTLDRRIVPPRLTNTDGDPFLFTADRWTFQGERRPEVIARISSLEGASAEDEGCYTLLRAGNEVYAEWDNTVIAQLKIEPAALVAETNSVARADAVRQTIEAACGELLSKRVRSHSDPMSSAHRDIVREPEAPIPEASELIRQLKEQHYAAWIDQPIPALGGKTPREAARTAPGRERLRLICNQIEITERTLPEGERFDVRKLRGQLGLTE